MLGRVLSAGHDQRWGRRWRLPARVASVDLQSVSMPQELRRSYAFIFAGGKDTGMPEGTRGGAMSSRPSALLCAIRVTCSRSCSLHYSRAITLKIFHRA